LFDIEEVFAIFQLKTWT